MTKPSLYTAVCCAATRTLACLVFIMFSGGVSAQNFPPTWTEPYPPFRIIGPLYGVGTADLSAFLIATDAGHILINTGIDGSLDIIRDNMAELGFALEDIRILLTQQAHFDHTAALADIKDLSGARMLATELDARVLEDGGFSDPHFGGEVMFKPVAVDRIIRQGDLIELGDVRLTVHEHPGHTEGSSSYTFTIKENGQDYKVAILNMGTINDGKKLVEEPTYPGVAKDFAYTYASQKTLEVDVWVAAHGSQYNLADKHTPGQTYDPNTFVDPEGLKREVERLESLYLEQLGEEQSRTAYAE